ncbi:MAG: hypothetical protein ISS70_26595 [Phycisphaerae bacterium]|nr:hypothetical protein [Phycisphaerae bacterium]
MDIQAEVLAIMKKISQRQFFRHIIAIVTLVVLLWAAGYSHDMPQQEGQPSALSPQPEAKADSQMLSAEMPRAARGENDRILIETDCLTAEIWPNGYVSGVKSNTLVDRKTGSRDSSFGLDIVDFLMGPGAEDGIPYQFGDKIRGNIAKHYVELPQICTQARRIDSDFIIGRDFVAVRQWWRWTEAAPGYTPGSICMLAPGSSGAEKAISAHGVQPCAAAAA